MLSESRETKEFTNSISSCLDNECLKSYSSIWDEQNQNYETIYFGRYAFNEFIYYSSINPPVFEEAVSTCKNISNEDVYATEYGTLQDKCIANYMGEPRDWEYMLILIGIIGVFFVCPLIIYIFSNLIKYR